MRKGRRKLGFALIALVGAVLCVLEEANGPGTGPKSFAERRSYDMVKDSMHETSPSAFAVGVVGLGVALLGGRLTRARTTR